MCYDVPDACTVKIEKPPPISKVTPAGTVPAKVRQFTIRLINLIQKAGNNCNQFYVIINEASPAVAANWMPRYSQIDVDFA